jgi:hypothetical protein
MASLLSVSFCVVTKIIAETARLAFFFLIALFENYVGAFLRVIHMGVESGEILAQRHSGGAGRPEGQNLGALVAPCG